MRQEYFDPIERFPERMDQLLNAINRVCSQISHLIDFDDEYLLVIFATNIRKNLND